MQSNIIFEFVNTKNSLTEKEMEVTWKFSNVIKSFIFLFKK